MTEAATNAQIQLSGVLLQDAEVRTMPMGEDKTPMPVICLVLRSDGSCSTPVRAEQVYPAALRRDAERIAAGMKKGMRITVWAPIAHMRTTLAMSSRIEVHGRARPMQATEAKEATCANT